MSKVTLCQSCQKADCSLGGCSWSNHLIPVEGWKAEPTSISYLVIECPEYIEDPPRGRINPAILNDIQDYEFKKDPLEYLRRYSHEITDKRSRGGGVREISIKRKRYSLWFSYGGTSFFFINLSIDGFV